MSPRRAPVLLACLAAPLAAAQTSLPPRSGEPIGPPRAVLRFVALGDYGTGTTGAFALAQLVHALAPDFVITLGDNNYPSGDASTIDGNIGRHYHRYIHPYLGAFGPGADVNRFFPTLGNHDWIAPGAEPYLGYFTLPGNERYYDVRRGPLHFFCLDSDLHEPDGITAGSVQASWLRAALAASDAPFKIVYMHHAPYNSSATHGSQADLQWPFREWGAHAVLNGHDHLYERLYVSGFPYVTNGLGGRSRYEFGKTVSGSEARFNAAEGLIWGETHARATRLRFVTVRGAVVDDITLAAGGIDPGVTPLIPLGAQWKYLDTGVDPGPRWKELLFDDSAWLLGSAELGYGDGDEETVVGYGGDPANRHITTWFRRAFHVPDPAVFGRLQLRLRRDDGAVVYLNGVQVGRSNMPSGTITEDTLAATNLVREAEKLFHPYHFEPGLLVPGRNVLAVELHQSNPGSVDISFDIELVGLGAGFALVPRGSSWRYRDTGVDPGPAWSAPGYDDSSWPLGPAQLGYGEGDEATTLSFGGDPSARHATTWFRRRFVLPDADLVRWLACEFVFDDGAIVYLNGNEVLRINLARDGIGARSYSAYPVGGVNEHVAVRTSLDPSVLVDGVNTLAVELHNADPASDDLSFDLELIAH